MQQKLAAGNWKMNGLSADLEQLTLLTKAHPSPQCDILICPPAPLLHRAAKAAKGSLIAIGAQDCHANESGAHTGDTSAAMLVDAGASHVILGHSERRQDHGETDPVVRAKSEIARSVGLVTIICVGETLTQRESGQTLDVISQQLAGSLSDDISAQNTIIAYEPVWAIGTGKIPTLDQIGEVHAHMREVLITRFGHEIAEMLTLLYGGSVKPDNAANIFAVAHVDGALVGGASLKAQDFSPIIAALDAS